MVTIAKKVQQKGTISYLQTNTRWFKYDRDYLCVNKSQLVPVIFEPPCTMYYFMPFTCEHTLDVH